MKLLITLVILTLYLFSTHAQFAKVGVTSCQLCMLTYKINCTICYNRCNDLPNLLNCTYSQCTSRDANNNCISYANVIKKSSQCLGQCCSGFDTATIFSQNNFNLCIERDASLPNNINIGLTLGLVLTLLALLFFAGLACLLVIIMITNRQKTKKQQFNLVFAKNMPNIVNPSSKFLNPVNMDQINDNNMVTYNNTQAYYQNLNTQNYNPSIQAQKINPTYQQVIGEWKTDGRKINGRCYLCGNGEINFLCNCAHEFHYRCLFFNVKYDEKCPVCHEIASLNVARIYCTKCWTNFKSFDIAVEKLSLDKMNYYDNIICPRCL